MAVFTEQEIMQSAVPDVNAILENALYLESGSTMITPQTVAVTENSAVQAMVVRFGDIAALAEEYGYNYIDAMVAVAEANEIDPNVLAVAVDEAEIIENPDLVGELDHVVINPQSENSFAYKFCEAMVDAWIESDGTEGAFLEAVVDDEVADQVLASLDEAKASKMIKSGLKSVDKAAGSVLSQGIDKIKNTFGFDSGSQMVKDRAGLHNMANGNYTQGYQTDEDKNAAVTRISNALGNRQKAKTAGKVALGLGAAAAAGYAGKKLYNKIKGSGAPNVPSPQQVLKQAAGKDKNWIGKKIASLRSMYQKWLAKAKAEKDAGRASAFKKVATAIMSCIDALMKKLQGTVGAIGTGK